MRVWLTGGNGMVGGALRRLAPDLAPDIEIIAPGRDILDLTDPAAVRGFLADTRIDAVIHAAGRVGGIAANLRDMAGFLAENLAINLAVIEGARRAGIGTLINFGSSCMYPVNHRQPLIEEDILASPLEPTNEGYALAKIAAARHCAYIARETGAAFRTIIPCNLYGPGDHFSLTRGHLVASAIRKTHDAKLAKASNVEIWGDGTARREFLYVDDLAGWVLQQALQRARDLPQDLNVGFGDDFSVTDYYRMAAKVVGYEGDFQYAPSRPTGMQQKLMSSARAEAFGWRAVTSLDEGMAAAYRYFLQKGDE